MVNFQAYYYDQIKTENPNADEKIKTFLSVAYRVNLNLDNFRN